MGTTVIRRRGRQRVGWWILGAAVGLALGILGCKSDQAPQEPAEPPPPAEMDATDQASEPPASAQLGQATPPMGVGPDGAALIGTDSGTIEAIAERLARLDDEEEAVDNSLPVVHLLSRGEVRELTGFTGALQRAELEGQPSTESYNAFRLATEDSYGFGLQVWKFRNREQANSHFNRLRETYILTGSTRVNGENAFTAELGGIRQLVFVSDRVRTVVALSCDEDVCIDGAVLSDLAERVEVRL